MEFWLNLTIKYAIIDISKSFIIKEAEPLRKKYYVYQIMILIVVISIVLFSFVYKNREKDTTAYIDPNSNAIRQYYYDSIPGLIRAEQLDMVKPIHKTFNIPDTHYRLKIDRIWYNSRDAFIFYHVENIDHVAYLGDILLLMIVHRLKKFTLEILLAPQQKKGSIIITTFIAF